MNTMCRVQFELPEKKLQELECLMEEVNVSTKRELFNNALTLLEWASKECKRGRIIASVD